MKSIFSCALFYLFVTPSFADFVYMREDSNAKSVILQKTNQLPVILNNSSINLWALYPDISSDGNEFIYAEGPDENNLHLTYINSSKNLTQRFNLPQKGMLLHPKFSKNSELIFYSAPHQGKNAIFFFNRALEVQRQGEGLLDYSLENSTLLTDEHAYFPRPSSDGNFVVYQRNQGGKKEIVLFDRLENKKTIIAEGMSPALSFDETLIAYTSKKDGNWNIYIFDRFNGKIEQVTSDSADEMSPTFKKDNSLVFASNKSGHYRLYQLSHGKWDELIKEQNLKLDFYAPHFSGETNYKQGVRSPFIGPARSSFGTIEHHEKIYMAGGHQGAEHTYPPESFSDMFIVHDIKTNQWTELAPRPVKAHGYQLAAYGQYIYAFGGFTYSKDHKPKWKSIKQIDRYDIAKNKWETIGEMLNPRSSNVVITINDKVYLAGGWDSTPKFENDLDGNFLDTIEIFDLRTETISLAPYKLPAPKRRALSGVAHQGKILLIGGLGEGSSHFELLNKVTEINPQDGSFKDLAPLPFPTFAPAAGVIENELLVFGGMFKTGPMNYEYVSHIYSLDFKQNNWRHTGRFLKETKGFSQVFSLDNKSLGVLGGHHYFQGMDSPVSTFETISK